jgi:hypothetical protein
MPTDAATEAVEHVKGLAGERREVFDPAELIDHPAIPRDPERLVMHARSAVDAGPRQQQRRI